MHQPGQFGRIDGVQPALPRLELGYPRLGIGQPRIDRFGRGQSVAHDQIVDLPCDVGCRQVSFILQSLHPIPGSIYLRVQRSQITAVVDDKIGHLQASLAAGLVCDASAGVGLVEPAMLDQAADRHIDRAVDHQHTGHVVPGLATLVAAFGQQRHIENHYVAGAGRGDLAVHFLADQRVNDLVQRLQLIGIVEHDCGHGSPIDAPVVGQDRLPEMGDHGLVRGLTGLLQLAGYGVGVNNDSAAL